MSTEPREWVFYLGAGRTAKLVLPGDELTPQDMGMLLMSLAEALQEASAGVSSLEATVQRLGL